MNPCRSNIASMSPATPSEAEAACVFCRIVRGQLPAQIVTRSDALVAVRDINPQAPQHLLIFPTAHIPTLADVTETQAPLMGEALLLANRLARDHRLQAGYRVVINCGAQAGQTVWHLHLHLLGGRSMGWPPG